MTKANAVVKLNNNHIRRDTLLARLLSDALRVANAKKHLEATI